MSGSLTQFGIGKETAYATGVAPTKFYEIMKEDFTGSYPRLQADALSASLVDRSDRFQIITNKGASGSVSLEPLSKGFGHWLYYMMGAVGTTGPTETVCYTHTGTIATLTPNKSLTVQVGRGDDSGVVKPWTYEGGKVTDWEFSNSAEQTLRANIGMDFAKESNADVPAGIYVLATNVAVTGAEVLTAAGGTITVGGTAYDVLDISVKCDNKLNSDRAFIRKGASKREPAQDGKRKITFSLKMPYVDNTFWEKVSSATLAGTYATLVAKWEGLTLLGTTVYPKLEFTIPVARFDEGGPTVDGASSLEQTVTGVGLFNGTDSAVSIAYISGDITVLPN